MSQVSHDTWQHRGKQTKQHKTTFKLFEKIHKIKSRIFKKKVQNVIIVNKKVQNEIIFNKKVQHAIFANKKVQKGIVNIYDRKAYKNNKSQKNVSKRNRNTNRNWNKVFEHSKNLNEQLEKERDGKTQRNYAKNPYGIFKTCPVKQKTNGVLWQRKVRRLWKRDGSWSLHSVIISLLVLNVAGVCTGEDGSSFASGVASRMISFLGYGHTCTVGGVSRQCTLTLSCWLRGGTRLRGCGWLFSCCAPPEFDNSASSSDWKYKVSPPKLRQVPQRNVMPNNVFRRRVDEDATQMDCGLPSSRILHKRIIGGREARFAEFPWQAHVRISEFQCGGVLVSRWFVATAAHCVSRASAREVSVWLGAVDTGDTQPAAKLRIIKKILHPLFQFRMTQPDRYDIALLKFSRPVTYSSHILPICLPDYDLELRGRSGVIAGWGKTDASSGHTGTNLLRSATVPILSKEQCINWHQIKQISVEIHSEMICAGHSDGHQDACLGDSGGPLIILDNGRYYLAGITSAGFGCGVDHQPGIYHNVKITANWIRNVIANTYNYIDV